jgi:hypothetical protein
MTVLVNNLTDLTVEVNADEAWRELGRATDDAALTEWAKTWGEPALLAIDELRKTRRNR